MNKFKRVDVQSLRKMQGKKGLILQGCGGDLNEWLFDINTMLTKEGILKNGSEFKEAIVFENGPLTNLLLLLDDVELNFEKLAFCRLKYRYEFMGTWLSDYVDKHLGGFIEDGDEGMTLC